MRLLSPPANRFNVQIKATAWAQISHLSADDFRRVREELDSIAAQALAAPVALARDEAEGTSRGALSAIVGEHVLLYDVDTSLKLVTLLEIARRLPHGE